MPAKAKLVTRSASSSSVSANSLGKGTELTFAELDSNLINLRDQTIGFASDDSTTTNIQAGDTLYVKGGTGITTAVSGDTVTITATDQGFGDLIAVGSTIKSPTNADIVLEPGGTGEIHLKTDGASTVKIGEATNNNYFDFIPDSGIARYSSSGTTDFILQHSTGGSVTITDVNEGEIKIAPYQSDATLFGSASHNATISSNGAHDLILSTNNGTNAGTITLTDGANGNITLAPNGTGSVVIGTLTLNDNEISSTNSNDNLVLNTSGTGIVEVNANITATGNIANDAISITDNTIIGTRTNETIVLDASGTGLVQVGSGTDGTSAASSNVGALMMYENLTDVPGTREYALGRTMMIKTNGADSSSGNVRYRIQDTIQLDLNDSALTSTSTTRGPQMQHLIELKDTSSGTSTAGAVTGQGTGIFFPGSGGSGSTINVTNAFSIRSFGLSTIASGETATVTNYYHYFADAFNDAGSGTTNVTNEFAFYDNGNKTSRFGSVILANQSGDPSTVTDSAHIYAKDDSGSSEVHVRDEAGNVTKISPHNAEGEWEYYSKNTKTGKTVRVNMEKMIRKLEEFTGETFLEQE